MSHATILTVLQCKGGVGKTTVAATLAAAAHLTGLRTLMLDLEPRDHCGLASKWFEMRAPDSPLSGLVTHLALDGWTPHHVRMIGHDYDLVVCDCPAGLAGATRAAAVASTLAVVPMMVGAAEVFSLQPVFDLLAKVNEDRAMVGHSALPWGFLLNALPREPTKGQQQFVELLAQKGNVFPVALGRRAVFGACVAAGECALTYRPRDATAMAESWNLLKTVLQQTPLAERVQQVPVAHPTSARPQHEPPGSAQKKPPQKKPKKVVAA